MRDAAALAASLVVLACSCGKTEPTKSGVELVHWDKTSAMDPTLLAMKEVGPRTSKDIDQLYE